MIIRVRSKVGCWRLEVQPRTTLSEVMARIEHEHSVKVATQRLCYPTAKDCVSSKPTTTVGDLGMNHGDMMRVFAPLAASQCRTRASTRPLPQLQCQGSLGNPAPRLARTSER